ncbi:hypothetical protein KKJ09_18925, partial [Xenorhabdus bovienii]|uniref:hypothetical protein n=1 Tax=Xenorhabdus bovienii TaxID=40576 RepID=UPI0023B230F1
FKRVSDQGHRSGLAQKQGSLPDDRLMRQNPAVSNAFEIDIRVDLFYQDQTVRGLSELIISELEELLRDK